MQDLADTRFPEVRWIVPGLFPEGVILLASRPKLGKSWLLLQICAAVATGNSTLVSADQPICGDVLYLDLENGRRRLQKRGMKYFGGLRTNWPKRMTTAHAWRRFDEGGLADLTDWCRSVDEPRLIAIDTLAKVRPPKKTGQSDYSGDYGACEGLLDIAQNFPGLAFIVAHHDRKMEAESPFDTVSGTLGLTGGVDTVALLKRSGLGVTFHIQGRDLPDDIEKAVSFDRETCRWVILGEASDIQRSDTRKTILDVLLEADALLGPKDISAATGLRQETVRQQLLKMSRAGEVVKAGTAKYRHPDRSDLGASVTPVTA
jgi:hypothetical protein